MSGRLTALAVRKASKRGLFGDGGGLYLRVGPTGARSWILRTVVRGKRRDLGLGSASLVSLAEAREKAREWRKIARASGDPTETFARRAAAPTFEEAARIVHAEQVAASARNGKHVAQWIRTLEIDAFPTIGVKRVDEIAQADVLAVLAPIWLEKPETARRVRQRLRAVLDWARAAGHAEGANPVEGIERGLPKQRDRTRHFAAVPWQDVPDVVARLAEVRGAGALALRFAVLTAARSGEVRGATWDEIVLEARTWTLPEGRMKAGRAHRVPLSEAAMAALSEAAAMRDGALAFPSTHRRGAALSDMTLSAALKRAGVKATVHGFRSSFRDWCEERTAFPHEVKEAALAHAVRSRVEAAYRRTDLFDKRRELMERWGAFCTGAQGAVVALPGRHA